MENQQPMTTLIPLTKPEAALFWGAPPPADSELSPEDPLALDYLSQQMGLWLLPRLTTRTSRAQYYAVVLYGLYIADLAIAARGLPADDETRKDLFERWERFWALSVMESLGGALDRGHPDAMRGVRGATRAWRPGHGKLPLDYTLISRQLELAGLGAYLSSLRATGLVIDGTLRPSPVAREILDAFWDEVSERDHRGRYEAYALLALDPARDRIDRKNNNLTLRRLGRRARLTAIHRRPAQQARLFERLLGAGADENTRAMGKLVQNACLADIVDARALLDAAIDGRLGAVPASLAALLRGARAFGDVSIDLLRCFNRIYGSVRRAGWVASRAEVARTALPAHERDRLQAVCQAMLAEPRAMELRNLPVHGSRFVQLVTVLAEASADAALDALLTYHRQVQRDRRGGNGWLVEEDDRLIIGLSSYQQYDADVRFPGFKLDVVRSLLHDLGRLTTDGEAAA